MASPKNGGDDGLFIDVTVQENAVQGTGNR
jgi:hypothetical protein